LAGADLRLPNVRVDLCTFAVGAPP
jgi:hypothetical protein